MKINVQKEVPPDFDWEYYLLLNKDVKLFPIFRSKSGAENHWVKYGQYENRVYRDPVQSVGEHFPPNPRVDVKDITVIIPNKLGQTPNVTIDSLYKQTYKNFDIIVINDIHNNANIARNEGLKLVKTEFVLFSDNDILWDPFALEELRKCLIENGDVSYSYGSWVLGKTKFANIEWNENRLLKQNYISTMSLVRTKDHPGFDEKILRLQDWDVWLTMLKDNKRGKYIKKHIFDTNIRRGITNGSIDYNVAHNIIKEKHSM